MQYYLLQIVMIDSVDVSWNLSEQRDAVMAHKDSRIDEVREVLAWRSRIYVLIPVMLLLLLLVSNIRICLRRKWWVNKIHIIIILKLYKEIIIIIPGFSFSPVLLFDIVAEEMVLLLSETNADYVVMNGPILGCVRNRL